MDETEALRARMEDLSLENDALCAHVERLRKVAYDAWRYLNQEEGKK